MPIVRGWSTGDVDVAVVGAGAAGLAAARHLCADPGLRVLVCEAGDRLGGRAFTLVPEAPNCPIDLGCTWLHGARGNAWRKIAEETGFTVDRNPAPWDEGGPIELGLRPEDRSDYEAAVADFYGEAELAAAAGRDMALGDLLDRGSRWRGLLDAVSTFVSGAELARISVQDHACYQPGEGPDWRVREGYGRLIAAYGAPVPVLLDTPVTRIDHSAADRIRIETPRGTLRARAVIVTVSTDVLAGGLIEFAPALPEKTEAAALLPLGLADKIFLRVDPAAGLPAEGYRLGDPHRARTGAYHLRPFGRPIIEGFVGGDLARDLEAEGETAAFAFAIDELAAHFGAAIRRHLTPLRATAWAREPFIRGSYAYAVPGAAGRRASLAAPVEDRLFFAGEACSPRAFTTAHGAYETGVAAAKAVAAALKRP